MEALLTDVLAMRVGRAAFYAVLALAAALIAGRSLWQAIAVAAVVATAALLKRTLLIAEIVIGLLVLAALFPHLAAFLYLGPP
jgi:hypothetical protein